MFTRYNLNELRKSLGPGVLVVLTVLGHGFITGEWNLIELAIGTVGLVHTFLAFMTTNVPGFEKAKAYVPLVVNLIGVCALWAATGTLNREELVAAGTAVVLALITGNVSNLGRTNNLGSFPAGLPGRA